MTRIPLSDCKCPYCGVQFQTAASRVKKCPSCEQKVYIRRAYSDRQRYLVTEDELPAIENEWAELYARIYMGGTGGF